MYSKVLRLSFVFLLFSMVTFSQSAKKFYSAGSKFQELKNYKDAISNYTSAIGLDPEYEKAYVSRAFCYEMTGEKELAIKDYETSINFSPKEKEYYFNAGRLYYELNNDVNAIKKISEALARDDRYAEAIDVMIKILHRTNRYLDAIKYCEIALDIKTSSVNYYNHAVTLDSLKSYDEAAKQYKNSKYYDSKFIPAYVGLAYVQIKQNKLDEAFKTCETAIIKDPGNSSIYNVRSSIYALKNDYNNAVNDMTKVIVSNPDNINSFLKRAGFYEKLGQYQNAISDYTKVLFIDNKNHAAYYNRANCYAQLANFKEASKDYEKIVSLSPYNAQATALLKDVKKKLYDYNRESVKPEIELFSPKPDKNNRLKVLGNVEEVIIKGKVNDESQIKSISINGDPLTFNQDTLNPDFEISLKAANLKELIVSAKDIYDNEQKSVYTVEKTETNKPMIALQAPYASDDGVIYLDNNNSEIYVEGKIKDESNIASVTIDDVTASFSQDALNPSFSAKISIANKFSLTLKATDVNNNETTVIYKLNRDGALMNQDNPMGTTWAIFIENANYKSMASLDGPTKDVMLMKSALVNYKISKLIHKKDMTKDDMEKFFSIELRDLVKSNNVKSLLIWYSGHGKFVSNTGYWIPTDATEQEFSYYNVNNIRSAMQSYDKVVHTLVLTDACESGPSFMDKRRPATKERRCDDVLETRLKSAQVMASAGKELASDKSVFAKTFADVLQFNQDACIPIEKVAQKVVDAVRASTGQSPQLGYINGLDNEDATFFFMKK